MTGDERFDLGENGLLFHGPQLSRVITRTSMLFEGDYTKLRETSRAQIHWRMSKAPTIAMDRLKKDMAEAVERTSGRKFSLEVTGGANPDFYRNFVNNGQDKRMTAEVFLGIATALGKSPSEYIEGAADPARLPSVAVLTSTFAVLLDSLGIDPYEDERARKLAAQFPGALRSIEGLRAQSLDPSDLPRAEAPPSGDGDRPSS